jgi:MFS family permease
MCGSCFFTPYQVVMHSGKVRPLGQTVGLYNLAWMSGYVLGPLIGGALINFSRPLIHIVMLMVAVIGYQLIELAVMRARADGRDHATEPFDGADAKVQKRGRDFYIWIGWASLMAHGYAITTVFYVFPKLGHVRGFSNPQIAWAESLLTVAMLVTTVLTMWLRRGLYKPGVTVLAGACGAASVAVLALTASYGANIAGLLLLGASGGINCYVSVYYVNNHRNRPRAIVINETAVGLAGVIAPAMGALLGGGANPTLTPYWICAGVYAALAVGVVAFHALRATKAGERQPAQA